MEAQYKVVEETELALDAVNPAVYNPRKISGQQFQSLKKNIKKYGILERLIVNRRTGNTLVSGHQRLKVARELGFETVPVRVIDCDEKNEQILNLALNKIEGSFDNEKLQNVMKGLFEFEGFNNADLENTGFTQQEIDKMLAVKEADDEDGEYPIVPYFSEKYNYAIIISKNEIDWTYLMNALELRPEKSYKSTAIGLGHVVDFDRFRELWEKNKGRK